MYLIKKIKDLIRSQGLLDSRIVRRHYADKVGRPLDLVNPRRLHEKICWLKLYGVTPLHVFCTDKITAPAYVDSVLGKGHTAQRYFATFDPEKLDPQMIPSRSCVVKANHDYNSVFMVADTARQDWQSLRETLRQRLARNFYLVLRERQYRKIRPGIVVEEMLVPRDGGPLTEVKVFCFGGRATYFSVIVDGIQDKDSPKIFADRNWNVLDVNRLRLPFRQGTKPRPDYLDQLVEMAERLAEPFAFVRVDFYVVDGHLVVGELTFSPSGGYEQYLPDEFELAMGTQLDHRAKTRNWQKKLAAARACVPEAAGLL